MEPAERPVPTARVGDEAARRARAEGGDPPNTPAGDAPSPDRPIPAPDAPPPSERTLERRRARARRRLRRRVVWWAKVTGVALVVLVAVGLAGIALLIRHYEGKLPTVSDLHQYTPPQVSRVLARDGTVLGEIYQQRRTVVPISEVSEVMRQAILAAEDAHFYEHAGLNYLGMLRALWVNLRSTKTRQGASTITQQVVKNVLLTPERTFDRKVKEVILARRLEQELGKDQILELYLNQIFFGHGRYGIEEAARFYFGKGAKDLKLAEAALLAGIVKGPSVYSPRVSLPKALQQRARVLEQMKLKGFVSAETADAAQKEPIVLAPEGGPRDELAPEILTRVEREMKQLLGDDWETRGYTVTTSIDPALQTAARAALQKATQEWDKRHKVIGRQAKAKKEPEPSKGHAQADHAYRGVVAAVDDAQKTLTVDVGDADAIVHLDRERRWNPDGLAPSAWTEVGKVLRVKLLGELPAGKASGGGEGAPKRPRFGARLDLGPEGAVVVLDPKTREVLAWVGGWEAARGGFDRATMAKRQPGSTMKTFVYGYGIEARKLTGATLLETAQEALPPKYRPQNYDGATPEGRVPLRSALAQSVNVSAVWALDKVGVKGAVEFASKVGIKSPAGADLSFALGAYEVTPFELTNAYATLAAGGLWGEPRLVIDVKASDGTPVPLPDAYEPTRVMSEAGAFVMTNLLESVVQNGTAHRAKVLGRSIAGKTGTSNHAKDAWFVGYSSSVVCGVWIGFDDGEPLGAGESGGVTAVPAFVEVMKKALAARKAEPFVLPAGVERRRIDPASGLLVGEGEFPGAYDEVFLVGTAPEEAATPPAAPPGDAPGPEPSAPKPTLVAKP